MRSNDEICDELGARLTNAARHVLLMNDAAAARLAAGLCGKFRRDMEEPGDGALHRALAYLEHDLAEPFSSVGYSTHSATHSQQLVERFTRNFTRDFAAWIGIYPAEAGKIQA